ncbi:MAG: Maf family protein [Neisseriaceae bacterium]|nr:Maf family protein [Neisseriaceae bacterium]
MSFDLYLGSQSPRRVELLTQQGLRLHQIVRPIDESVLSGELATAYAERLAKEKAQAAWQYVVANLLPLKPLLTADTTVVIDGLILGKPCDELEAKVMLRLLSGRTHQVVTAVCVIVGDGVTTKLKTGLSVTEVTFKNLSDEEIDIYLATNDAYDKAGSYGIPGRAGIFIQHISGSFTGVMGLPLFETAQLLADFGLNLPLASSL